MSISSHSNTAINDWAKFAAISLLLAFVNFSLGGEFEGMSEPAALGEGPARHADQPAATDGTAAAGDCWQEYDDPYGNSPCNGEYRTNCSPGLMDEFAAMSKCMASQGIAYNVVVPQFYQGVTRGGRDEGFEYGGKVDQFITLDGGKLWGAEGFSIATHVETRYGQDINLDAVGFAPANVAMLYPKEGEHDTAITGLLFDQALDQDLHVTFGKYNGLDMFYALYPQTGRGVNTFMNASMVIPLSVARVVPLSFMGVGLTKYQDKKAQSGVMVFDNQDVTTTSGFDDMFDNGANIMGYYRFFTDVGGLPGSHMFGGIWATGDYVSFDPLSFVILPGEGVVFDRQSGAYTLLYILEQTLWVDRCDKNRNIGLLSQWGLADQETSPISWSCNVAIQAQGLNRQRPQDSIGVGYFHTALSDTFKQQLSPAFDLRDVDGVEMYYNAAVTKCFQLTADLQVIEPADATNDTAVVCGLRGTVGL